MADYLQPVSQPVRRLAIIALGLATLVLVAIVLFLAALPLFAPGFKPEHIPFLLGAIALFGVLLVACAWMLARILKGAPSSSGLTVLPLWFIRVFGVLFIGCAVVAAWHGQLPLLLLLEVGSVGLAMIFVGRLVRRAS